MPSHDSWACDYSAKNRLRFGGRNHFLLAIYPTPMNAKILGLFFRINSFRLRGYGKSSLVVKRINWKN
jgi:hypothetical protein